jgi:4a-hydroxytetrahydrobiopterin dehydratase
MTDLAKETCTPCTPGTPPLSETEAAKLLLDLGNGWSVQEGKCLEKDYKFPDFLQALAFTNRVAGVAETVGHHPDVHLSWGRVRLTLWTHSIGGLSRSDFVFAAKADAVL